MCLGVDRVVDDCDGRETVLKTSVLGFRDTTLFQNADDNSTTRADRLPNLCGTVCKSQSCLRHCFTVAKIPMPTVCTEAAESELRKITGGTCVF